MDTNLLIALVQEHNAVEEKKLSLRDISRKLPYIREGYLVTLYPAPEPTNQTET